MSFKSRIIIIALLSSLVVAVCFALVLDTRSEIEDNAQSLLQSNALAGQVFSLATLSKELFQGKQRVRQQWQVNLEATKDHIERLRDGLDDTRKALFDSQLAGLQEGVSRVQQIAQRLIRLENEGTELPGFVVRVMDGQLSAEVRRLSEQATQINSTLVMQSAEKSQSLFQLFSVSVGTFIVVIFLALLLFAASFFKKLSLLESAFHQFKSGDFQASHTALGRTELDDALVSFNEMADVVRSSRKELSQYADRLTLAANLAQLGVWEFDLDSEVFHWDRKMHEIFGTRDDPTQPGVPIQTWIERLDPHQSDKTEALFRKAWNDESKWDSDYSIVRPNGEIRHLKSSGIRAQQSGQISNRLVGVVADVTSEYELDAKLRESVEKEKRANQAKSEFLANMSHEIRTPMNGVTGLIDLLEVDGLTEQQHYYLKLVKSSSATLLTLINDILDFSKIEAGKLQPSSTSMSIEKYIGDVVKGFAREANAKGIELHLRLHDPGLDCVVTDPIRLSQILFNLVGNAIKFTSEGEVVVDVHVARNSEPEFDSAYQLEVTVRDTGIGISAHKIDGVMGPFVQADTSTVRSYGGTGLGLSIVNSLASLMGGCFRLTSEEGQGTVARVLLPVDRGQCSESRYTKPPAEVERNGAALKCLVVDSNPGESLWLQRVCESWGFNVRSEESAHGALKTLSKAGQSQEHFDVMLINSELPDASGLDAIAQLNLNRVVMPDVTMIMANELSDAEASLASELDIEGALIRPFVPSDIFNEIVTALGFERSALAPSDSTLRNNAERQLNILAAEDNSVNQVIVKDILENRGHQVTLAENGLIAVEQFQKFTFDAILMDVQMPVLDGFEATRKIRELEKQSARRVRIIGLTAHALPGDQDLCLKAGMDQYLTKPVLADQLIKVLETTGHAEPEPRTYSTPSRPQMDGTEPAQFDASKAMSVAGQSEQLFYKTLSMVAELSPELAKDLESCITQRDWDQAGRCAHKLKGMLANVAFNSLVDELFALENAIANKNATHCFRLWENIVLKMDELMKEIGLQIEKG